MDPVIVPYCVPVSFNAVIPHVFSRLQAEFWTAPPKTQTEATAFGEIMKIGVEDSLNDLARHESN